MGVNDPGLLLRAAAIDKAADELIAQASEATSGHGPADTGPTSQQHHRLGNAARLADKDVPPSAATEHEPKSARDPRQSASPRSPRHIGNRETPIPRAQQR
jgi:hypothetical protein